MPAEIIIVNSYGTASFPEDEMDVSLIGGWSERVLEYIKLYENKNAMLYAVEKYKGGTRIDFSDIPVVDL